MTTSPNLYLRTRPKMHVLKRSPYHSADHTHFYGIRWTVSNAYGGSTMETRAIAGKFIFDNKGG